jgi:hypothetical protein
MASLTLRNIDESLKASLRISAAENGRSMEEEARQILKHFLLRKKSDAGIGTLIFNRFSFHPPEGWICPRCRVTLSGRCLPFDFEAAKDYALIVADRNRPGSPVRVEDAQIAAIARTGGLTLATRNIKDFAGIQGLETVNPWTDPK